MWKVHPIEGYSATCWLTGLWFTQTKVEGIVLKAAWHWGSNSIVLDDPLGEPGRTILYVGLPSAWSSVEDDLMLSSRFVGEFLNYWGL